MPHARTHLILISDLYEGGNKDDLRLRIANLIRQDVNVITLLALCDDGKPSCDSALAADFASMGAPFFVHTRSVSRLMAAALKRADILGWVLIMT